jgi:uncharacterized repeat protein (TIGR04076 family)
LAKKIKITVVKGFTAEEVFGDDVPDYFPEAFESPCPMHPEGQGFVIENLNCPEGFCSWAYADIQKDLADLWLGGPTWRGRNPNYFSCSDGMRPVVFRVELLEE